MHLYGIVSTMDVDKQKLFHLMVEIHSFETDIMLYTFEVVYV